MKSTTIHLTILLVFATSASARSDESIVIDRYDVAEYNGKLLDVTAPFGAYGKSMGAQFLFPTNSTMIGASFSSGLQEQRIWYQYGTAWNYLSPQPTWLPVKTLREVSRYYSPHDGGHTVYWLYDVSQSPGGGLGWWYLGRTFYRLKVWEFGYGMVYYELDTTNRYNDPTAVRDWYDTGVHASGFFIR